jgi:hypothetical protein
MVVHRRQETTMDKSLRTREQLEALVLADLRAVPGCEAVSHVTVVAYDNYRVPTTWEVASFSAGQSNPEDCERVLADIIKRLQERFDVSG